MSRRASPSYLAVLPYLQVRTNTSNWATVETDLHRYSVWKEPSEWVPHTRAPHAVCLAWLYWSVRLSFGRTHTGGTEGLACGHDI